MKSSSSKKNMNQANALGSRPITRKNLPKLRLRSFDGWFTATNGITTVSNAVSEWKNLVPGGADLTQSTANLRPALTTINGLTALAPDGESGRGAATDLLTDGDLMDNIGTGNFYLGFVVSIDAFSLNTFNFIQKKQEGFGTGNFTIILGDSTNKRLRIVNGSTTVIQTDNDSFNETDKTYFIEIVRIGTTLTVYKNGENIKQVTDSTDNISQTGDLTIGSINCKLGEFICKKGTMPDRTRQIIEALMATKWNIGNAPTLSKRGRASGFGILPASNRFRNRPPRF
jgi:hypothetical protein